jgi:hypothetical protein
MPTPTYTPLATVTLGSSASSVSFASIPASYRDLIVVGDYTGSTVALVLMTFNGDSSNLSAVEMGANSGSGVFSGTATNINFGAIYGSNKMTLITQIMDYSATDKHKTVLRRGNNAQQSELNAAAGRWASTAAITSIALTCNSGTFSSGSTFNLYGVIA